MTRKVVPAKLKAAAEHLEWVCRRHANKGRVHAVLKVMQPMIDDAKADRIPGSVPDRNHLLFAGRCCQIPP